ncbi:hypothetical protein SLS55_009739 [Diplodia seriata]
MAGPPPGYPTLARIMGPYPGMAIFKRFAELNAHSLLIQQAELLEVERELEAARASDTDDRLPYNEKAINLINSGETGPDNSQWQRVLKARELLEKYNSALLRQAEINRLSRPRDYNLELLRDWLGRADGGNNFLKGVEELPWHPKETDDLVALSGTDDPPFMRWTAEKLVPFMFHSGLQSKEPITGLNAGLVEWKDKRYETAARILCILLSTIIPSLAIVVLYFIQSMLIRIIASIGFSAAFSVAVALLTSARPAEIFAATVA